MPAAARSGTDRKAVGPHRSLAAFALILAIAATAVVALAALGTWQVRRLSWKEALIARVDARVHAPPVAPPDEAAWPTVTAASDEYRHVSVDGVFLNDHETLVQAVTDLGAGFWVMTPLRTATGATILVNRGFVPSDRRDPASRPEGEIVGETEVTGLLRMSEPKGGFLRTNDPRANRWFSRDVAEIATARGLPTNAPFFIDADSATNPGGYPVGGLTVISFPNNHLVYAATWYVLAVMLVGAIVRLVRDRVHSAETVATDETTATDDRPVSRALS